MNGKNKASEEGVLDSVVIDSTVVESSQTGDFGIDSKIPEKEEKQISSVQLNKKKDAEKKKVTVSEKESDTKKSSSAEELATTNTSYDSNVKVKEENIVDKEAKTPPSPKPITSNSDYKKARDLFNSGNYKQALKLFESIKGSGVSEPNLDWYIEACKKKI
jgi:TolA-binding protein